MGIILKKGKDIAIKRNHPWVFSGAIAEIEDKLNDGDFVEVFDFQRNSLGFGHFHFGSIAIRMIGKSHESDPGKLFSDRIQKAYQFRTMIGFTNNDSTTCFRLIHGEGDGLSGLIIDIYGDTAIIQCHTVGMHRMIGTISETLQTIFGDKLTAIYDKSKESLPDNYSRNMLNSYLLGAGSKAIVLENNMQFEVNWETGQKTGFFLDQRDNRLLLQKYCKARKVLNTFCYSGGFSLFALEGGATSVDSVDVSEKAIVLCKNNIELNFPGTENHHEYAADVLDWLKENNQIYDVIVVDPPAFAKSLEKRHNAVQAYKRLNIAAIKSLAPNGILFTFSCSQVVDKQLFYDTIVSAAMECNRNVRVLHHLTQPADHPINLFHPEGSYLKGLVLFVE